MTASVRRGTRRSKPHNLSPGLAAVRCNRLAFLGPIEADLLVKSGLREMVAVALFLTESTGYDCPRTERDELQVLSDRG